MDPITKYEVIIVTTMTHKFIVEAPNKEEAKALADKMFDDGDTPWDEQCTDRYVDTCEELI